MRRQLRLKSIAAFVLTVITSIAHAGTVTPTLGSDTLVPGIPTGNSPDGNKNTYTLKIYYFAADGTLASATVPVPGIQAAPVNPTPAQAAAASAAKAAAIVAAINKANLPGVTASVNPATVKSQYPTGATKYDPQSRMNVAVTAEFEQTTYTVDGTRESCWDGFGNQDSSVSNGKGKTSYTGPTARLGPGVTKSGVDPTKESGNGKKSHTAGSPGTKTQGIDQGTGSSTGLSIGLDPSGNQSVVGFGFIDDTDPNNPVDYLAAYQPTSGLNDSQVLSTLATIFTDDYSSLGYSASYDTGSDTLSIDQPLSADTTTLWDTDTDTGLDFSAALLDVPEPTSVTLLAVTAPLLLRRKTRSPM